MPTGLVVKTDTTLGLYGHHYERRAVQLLPTMTNVPANGNEVT
jgi:hypothetical protein